MASVGSVIANNPVHLDLGCGMLMAALDELKDEEWETVVKMAIIARDLMVGNPKLKDLGFGEEAL